ASAGVAGVGGTEGDDGIGEVGQHPFDGVNSCRLPFAFGSEHPDLGVAADETVEAPSDFGTVTGHDLIEVDELSAGLGGEARAVGRFPSTPRADEDGGHQNPCW